MPTLFSRFRASSRVRNVSEAQDEARLEDAEREVTELQHRASRAIKTLTDRQHRNHWRESIEKMIGGVT